ncbi:MAG: hypothetical protein QOG23_1352 [Blastocatellia bacterium]|nr:hypothetical protein [Blastocatellia bacterium]
MGVLIRILSFVSTLTLALFLSWTTSSFGQNHRDTLLRFTAMIGNEAYFGGFTRDEAFRKIGTRVRAVAITDSQGLAAGELSNLNSTAFDNADVFPVGLGTHGRVIAIADASTRIKGVAPNSYYLIVEWDRVQNKTLRSVIGRVPYKRFTVEE